MELLVYLNGDLIPRSQAKLSPFDHGFLYGYGLFETMRAYGGSIFRLDHHLARLCQSAEVLGIAPKLASFNLRRACYDVLQSNKLVEARLRLTVSAGEGDITPDLATSSGVTVFIVAQKLVPLPAEKYERGFNTILSSSRRNSQSSLSRLKSICYLESILARQEARSAGADEALLLNEQGLVAEGSANNIFLVSSRTLVTPSVESGVLPGITREAILELSQYSGIETVEREVELDELVKAEEAFLTNSILEVMPLTRFEDRPIGSARPGVLTQRLMSAYRELVKKET